MSAPGGSAPDVFCRRVKIVNRRGLHARAAAKFVRIAEQYQSRITVANGGLSVTGTSIMGLMMLAATTGSVLEITATGDDAEQALDELEQLVADGFEEP